MPSVGFNQGSDENVSHFSAPRQTKSVAYHRGYVFRLYKKLRVVRPAFHPVHHRLHGAGCTPKKYTQHAYSISVHLIPQTISNSFQRMLSCGIRPYTSFGIQTGTRV